MTAITGYSSTNTPLDQIFGAGVVYIGATPIGVTKGGVKFDPARSYSQPEFDGKHGNIKGMHRPMHGTPTISFSMMELGTTTTGDQITKLEPGSSAATVGAVTTVTPAVGGKFISTSSYLTDVRVIWEKGSAGSGSYVTVYFPVGFCTKYDISGANKDNGAVSVVIEGCLSTSQAPNEAAYVIEERTTLPS